MPIQVLPWFVTEPIATLAIGFLIISDFNAILVCVAILLSRIAFKTACRNIVIVRGACIQANVTSSCVIPEERRLFVRVTHAHFNRPDVSLAV
jgi:hypothetical protein